jgi:hypothetical protein
MSQIKSVERVRELGEVYTHEKEIQAMLNLVQEETQRIESRFLEPSCGNGNFLVAILKRKLEVIRSRFTEKKAIEWHCLTALSSIYGVDICKENVQEARERLKQELMVFYKETLPRRKASVGFGDAVTYLLNTNLIHGDMLNETHKLKMTEFTWHLPEETVSQAVFCVKDLIQMPNQMLALEPQPRKRIAPVHYLELGNTPTKSKNKTEARPLKVVPAEVPKKVLAHA